MAAYWAGWANDHFDETTFLLRGGTGRRRPRHTIKPTNPPPRGNKVAGTGTLLTGVQYDSDPFRSWGNIEPLIRVGPVCSPMKRAA
jgi:hypothetical protein